MRSITLYIIIVNVIIMMTRVRCDFECVITNCIIIISESEVLRGWVRRDSGFNVCEFRLTFDHIIIYNFLIKNVTYLYIILY